MHQTVFSLLFPFLELNTNSNFVNLQNTMSFKTLIFFGLLAVALGSVLPEKYSYETINSEWVSFKEIHFNQ